MKDDKVSIYFNVAYINFKTDEMCLQLNFSDPKYISS